MQIRQATTADLDAMRHICQAVITLGDALPFAGDFDRDTFQSHWFGSHVPFVAETETGIVGMYKFGANYPGLGSHVASATYLVSPAAQGLGIGRLLSSTALSRRKKLATWPCSSTTW
jgi:L-amino acid N-acyltransferase YncA